MVGGRVYQRRGREGAGGFKIIGWEVKGFYFLAVVWALPFAFWFPPRETHTGF